MVHIPTTNITVNADKVAERLAITVVGCTALADAKAAAAPSVLKATAPRPSSCRTVPRWRW